MNVGRVEEERQQGGECVSPKVSKRDENWTCSMAMQLRDARSGHIGNWCDIACMTVVYLHHLNLGKSKMHLWSGL